MPTINDDGEPMVEAEPMAMELAAADPSHKQQSHSSTYTYSKEQKLKRYYS